MPKIVQTTAKWHSLHMLARLCSKSSKVTSYVDVQAKFRKGRGTRDQIANIRWIIEKGQEFQKNICFIDYTKAFDCVDQNKLWKILRVGNTTYLPPEKSVGRSGSNN